MPENKRLTPLMEQYFSIKQNYQEEILLFRMGDFYEMFDKDAVKASKILNITLTKRNREADDYSLCGIPYHSISKYLPKLLDAGKSVAICEQTEDPKQAKGIVQRGVIRVITPGTIIEQEYLKKADNNFLASISAKDNVYALAFLDISTQDIKITGIKNNKQRLFDELFKIMPTEIVISSNIFQKLKCEIEEQNGAKITIREFKISPKQFQIWKQDLLSVMPYKNLKTITAIEENESFLHTLYQADEFIREKGIRINFEGDIDLYNTENFMDLDASTIKHLELIRTYTGTGPETNTLCDLLDQTKTAMGTRKVRQWLLNPLQKKEDIIKRLNIVECFVNKPKLQKQLMELFSGISDIERINGRIINNNATPRDLTALRQSLELVRELRTKLEELDMDLFKEAYDKIEDFSETIKEITSKISNDPPSHTREGGYINPDCNSELSRLADIIKNSQKLILDYEQQQRELTGINNLKIGYNKVFGYYIDIPKSRSHDMPSNYKKRQTLVNNERYITEDLQELEHTIIHAEENKVSLEKEIYYDLIEKLKLFFKAIKSASDSIGFLDGLLSFSHISIRNKYTKPEITDEEGIFIEEGRHPLVEYHLKKEFIPNDLCFDKKERFFIITGPNMAGKSTYLRQNALIVLMAHIGCFVPARKACIPIIDRVFTRIGSSDLLSKGMSTFLVEMSETALILKKSTSKSLILLDEVGRGTSTYDGISIAWAISEYIYKNIGAWTMFATHYNELTILADNYEGISNMCIQVREYNGKLMFLRKIIPGIADKSYGIDVAEMAGLPFEVIEKARLVLANLENTDSNRLTKTLKKNYDTVNQGAKQRTLFERAPEDLIREMLARTDINNITPIEALLLLQKLKKKAGLT